MSFDPTSTRAIQQALATSLHRNWKFFFFEGVALLILGAAAIIIPQLATLTVAILIGWLLLFSGAVGLISTFRMSAGPGFWWSLLSAIIAIFAGSVLLSSPVTGAVSLTFVLIAFFLIEGVASIMFALNHRSELPRAWGAMLASGIVDLVLGAMIFLGLPSSAGWAIGLLVGINMVFGGMALIAMALHARTLEAGPVKLPA
jgi:uncharacterized membrane protein HdeD (DUF308 family)